MTFLRRCCTGIFHWCNTKWIPLYAIATELLICIFLGLVQAILFHVNFEESRNWDYSVMLIPLWIMFCLLFCSSAELIRAQCDRDNQPMLFSNSEFEHIFGFISVDFFLTNFLYFIFAFLLMQQLDNIQSRNMFVIGIPLFIALAISIISSFLILYDLTSSMNYTHPKGGVLGLRIWLSIFIIIQYVFIALKIEKIGPLGLATWDTILIPLWIATGVPGFLTFCGFFCVPCVLCFQACHKANNQVDRLKSFAKIIPPIIFFVILNLPILCGVFLSLYISGFTKIYISSIFIPFYCWFLPFLIFSLPLLAQLLNWGTESYYIHNADEILQRQIQAAIQASLDDVGNERPRTPPTRKEMINKASSNVSSNELFLSSFFQKIPQLQLAYYYSGSTIVSTDSFTKFNPDSEFSLFKPIVADHNDQIPNQIRPKIQMGHKSLYKPIP